MSQYYYTDGKERFGPFSIEQLGERNISENTLVWKEGLPDWVPARNLNELSGLFSLAASMPPPIEIQKTYMPPEAPPKNWLIESILVTLLCCLPLGIVGIVYATKVDTLWTTGQREEALRASKEAGKWVKIGAISGFVIIVLYIIFIFFGIFAGISSGLEV